MQKLLIVAGPDAPQTAESEVENESEVGNREVEVAERNWEVRD